MLVVLLNTRGIFKVMSSGGKLNSRAVHCQSDRHGCLLMDVNVCILVVTSVPNRDGDRH